jgi:hypothetical protein
MIAKDTQKSDQAHQGNSVVVRKHFKFSWRVFAIILLTAAFGSISIIVFNNCSLWSDKKFSNKLDEAIEKATGWVYSNEAEILKTNNVGLIKMLRDCNILHPTGNFGRICDKFMATPSRPACWKAFLDPNYRVQKWELDLAIEKEFIDNKWLLYAIAPDKANITPEQMGLFSREKQDILKTVHKLWALSQLRKTQPKVNNEELIELLCDRIAQTLTFTPVVIDHTIQKTAFVLYAGHPEKIRRRWIEKAINNQLTDGGWNDRWFRCESRERRIQSLFTLGRPPSNPHGTIEALWLLYQAKYRYPKYFGLD